MKTTKSQKLCRPYWTYAFKFFGHLERGQVTNETFFEWAQELNLAVIGFRAIRDRKSPARCLACGSERVTPAEYLTDPDHPTAKKLIHPGCGGTLEAVNEGDIFMPVRSLRVKRYSLDGEFLGWFEDDRPRVGDGIREVIDYSRKHAG